MAGVSDAQLSQMLATQTAQSAQAQPTLPSASSALSFVRGEPGSLAPVLLHTILRAGLVGVGLYVAGYRRRVLKTALIASISIEAFVIGWAWWSTRNVAPVT